MLTYFYSKLKIINKHTMSNLFIPQSISIQIDADTRFENLVGPQININKNNLIIKLDSMREIIFDLTNTRFSYQFMESTNTFKYIFECNHAKCSININENNVAKKKMATNIEIRFDDSNKNKVFIQKLLTENPLLFNQIGRNFLHNLDTTDDIKKTKSSVQNIITKSSVPSIPHADIYIRLHV